MGKVAHIWRHPIKSHGREEVLTTDLLEAMTMPGDRVWAVRHDASQANSTAWAPCANFSRVAKSPALMAIDAELSDDHQSVRLTHPDLPTTTFRPDESPKAFFDWVHPLNPENRAAPAEILRVAGRGMTDSPYASISLINLSSHRAVAQKLGRDISAKRWRANFWCEDLAPWEEFEWVGKEMRLGSAVIRIEERTVRCMATTASPRTGKRDADTLGALENGWGHQDFGVCAVVLQSGTVAQGDRVELI